jgi:membrane protease subunit (stomatin/prohibitin family)
MKKSYRIAVIPGDGIGNEVISEGIKCLEVLSEILEGRGKLDVELQKVISDRTSQWGVEVSSVEIRDVVIPSGLQNAMSMQAQAEREQHARVILGESEKLIAGKFTEAANTYANNPGGMHLRAMNMLYEGMKTGNAMIVVVPASVLNTMSLGDTTGIIALAKTVTDQKGAVVAATHKTLDYFQADEDFWQAAYAQGRGAINLTDICTTR